MTARSCVPYSAGRLAYLGLWFPRHGLEQLVEVRPVALGVPTGLVQRRQPLALLHVVHWRRGKTESNQTAGRYTTARTKPRRLNLATALTSRPTRKQNSRGRVSIIQTVWQPEGQGRSKGKSQRLPQLTRLGRRKSIFLQHKTLSFFPPDCSNLCIIL